MCTQDANARAASWMPEMVGTQTARACGRSFHHVQCSEKVDAVEGGPGWRVRHAGAEHDGWVEMSRER